MKKKYLEPVMKVQSIDLKNALLTTSSAGISDELVEGGYDVKENILEW